MSKNDIVIVDFISNQNVLLCLPILLTFVFHLLEPKIAVTRPTIAAVAIVLTASHSLVSLTRSLELESGTHHFALQKAVAARVSCEEPVNHFLVHLASTVNQI